MTLKNKIVTIKDKLETLMHGHLSLKKEPLEIHLDSWYLTNKGNLCKAPRGKGRESLINAIYNHPDYNKEILEEYKHVRNSKDTWGKAYYMRKGALCHPSNADKGESDDR